MRRCPFRVNKTINSRNRFKDGYDTKEVVIQEEYPYCTTDCPFHNDKNGKCMRVSIELNKALTTLVLDDDRE